MHNPDGPKHPHAPSGTLEPNYSADQMPALARRDCLTGLLSGSALLLLPELLHAEKDGNKDAGPIPSAADGFPHPLIAAPADPQQWPAWREALAKFRKDARNRLNYDDSLYRRQDFAWVRSCFTCGFLMLNDERFMDAAKGRYRVDEFLDAEAEKFTKYDALVLWQAYPRIGIDDRNQFDHYRDMPGGLKGLRDVVQRLHARDIKAFICFNPWDNGTRQDGQTQLQSLVEMVHEMQADGIFLDTMNHAWDGFRQAIDAVRPGVAFESEIALPNQSIHDHHLSWAQWFRDSHAPGVLRNKWFERRHMQHQIARWSWDHTAELHMTWMNGSGMMIWENVFGQWVGWNRRDQSILRAMLPIQRRFVDLFAGDAWTPLVPSKQPNIFASQWGEGRQRLWTLVNRTSKTVEGPLLDIQARPQQRFFDLIQGREVAVTVQNGRVTLSGKIGPRGIGCFYTPDCTTAPREFETFLAEQRRIHARSEDDATPARSTARRTPVRPTKLYAQTPQGMLRIPAAELFLTEEFRVREVGFHDASPQRPIAGAWLNKKHTCIRRAKFSDLAIDATPVTNRQFAKFLHDSVYEPAIKQNFLKHWPNGIIPADFEEHPVVYVSLDDARAFATWAGRRLPTQEEWQYAAQGPQALMYPWGSEDDAAKRNGGQSGGTTPVTAHPAGRSPFGLYDCCGNTWELTESEHSDGRNRFVMLKGGSYYRAQGSNWYFDGGPQPNRHVAKLLLFWPGLDRSATIGFRCAVDLK